ncbi:MAG: hypothetical protein JHC33_05610 [Ignisphaera sp.]|nr:hypothetical protein [Ignisphaera sp.]
MAQLMIEGQYTSDTVEATALKHAEVIGWARAVSEIITEYKDSNNYEE